MKSIKTAVFPVAGMGTRFLPITKTAPKEMLPIVDKPVIQYAVSEAIAGGVEHLVFVTSSSKRALEDYFDINYELEARLKAAGKTEALEKVRNIVPKNISISYVRQSEPLGLGHAVLCAKRIVGDSDFAVLLPDDVIDCGADACLAQMAALYAAGADNVIAVETVPDDEVNKYGIVDTTDNNVVKKIIEKPAIGSAPSNLAVVGRYILSHKIFSILEKTPFGIGNELQLTDAIATLMQEQQLIAHPFHGTRYDCGSKEGWLAANINFSGVSLRASVSA